MTKNKYNGKTLNNSKDPGDSPVLKLEEGRDLNSPQQGKTPLLLDVHKLILFRSINKSINII